MNKNRKVKRLSLSLFLLLFVLSAVDYAVTVVGLSTGSIVEANPVMRFILEHTTYWGGMLVKQLMILPIGITIYRAQRFDWLLWPCVALYAGVVIWNVVILFVVKVM